MRRNRGTGIASICTLLVGLVTGCGDNAKVTTPATFAPPPTDAQSVQLAPSSATAKKPTAEQP
jgi:hypothetical protein